MVIWNYGVSEGPFELEVGLRVLEVFGGVAVMDSMVMDFLGGSTVMDLF